MRTNGARDNKRLYVAWCKMKSRCYSRTNKDFKHYGGRGIIVCNEWVNNFPEFLKWSLKNGYSDNLTIDRINNDKGYSPNNCRWVTQKEQASNKRNNRLIEINGITKTLTQWAEYSGINRTTIKSRIDLGWKNEEILIPTLGRGSNGSTAR